MPRPRGRRQDPGLSSRQERELQRSSTSFAAAREKNLPVFFAYLGTGYNVGSGVWRRIDALTEVFDTAGWFDPVSGTFTPLRAGRYLIMSAGQFGAAGAAGSRVTMHCWKNGAMDSSMQGPVHSAATSIPVGITGLAVIELDGESDYCDVRIAQNSGAGQNLQAGRDNTWVAGYFLGGM